MNRIFNILENLVFHRNCFHCGTFDTSYEVTCEFCWIKLLAHFQNEQNRNIGAVEVTALFSWIPGLGNDLGQFLYSCKTLNNKFAWKFFAEEWIRRAKINQKEIRMTKTILIPIPSQSERKHAEHFAYALSDLTGFEVLPALKFHFDEGLDLGKKEQKFLSKKQRANRKLEVSEEFTKVIKDAKRVILVDDVITTGATARAASRALSVDKIELWCLADRRQLAASS